MAKKSSLPDRATLTNAEKDDLILSLFARLEALESKVHKDSHKSGKPPSSDGLTKKTRSLRGPSDKKAGGQTGHKGTTLRQIAQATQTVRHPLPIQCDRCHSQLPLSEAIVSERRQVFDVPAMAFDVIEHHTLALVCRCGQKHESVFPADVTEVVQYGPNVRALGVHLTQGQMLPFACAAELIRDIYGLSVSPGTLVAWVHEARIALQGTANLIAEQFTTQPCCMRMSLACALPVSSIAFNLLRRLRQHADAALLFIRDLAVPFTNNVGERAVRMPKVKQKISGCFRTLDGAENFCVIRYCLDTLHKQRHGMLDVLRCAFTGNTIQPARCR